MRICFLYTVLALSFISQQRHNEAHLPLKANVVIGHLGPRKMNGGAGQRLLHHLWLPSEGAAIHFQVPPEDPQLLHWSRALGDLTMSPIKRSTVGISLTRDCGWASPGHGATPLAPGVEAVVHWQMRGHFRNDKVVFQPQDGSGLGLWGLIVGTACTCSWGPTLPPCCAAICLPHHHHHRCHHLRCTPLPA